MVSRIIGALLILAVLAWRVFRRPLIARRHYDDDAVSMQWLKDNVYSTGKNRDE